MYKEPDTGMEKIMLYTIVFFTFLHLGNFDKVDLCIQYICKWKYVFVFSILCEQIL